MSLASTTVVAVDCASVDRASYLEEFTFRILFSVASDCRALDISCDIESTYSITRKGYTQFQQKMNAAFDQCIAEFSTK